MSVLYFLIPAMILLATVFLIFFFRSVSKGEMDDLVTPSMRVITDDSPVILTSETLTKESQL